MSNTVVCVGKDRVASGAFACELTPRNRGNNTSEIVFGVLNPTDLVRIY